MSVLNFIPGTKDYRQRLKRHPTKKYNARQLGAITHLAIHHSLTKTGSAESFARYHVDTNNWPGIGYHFVIEKNGTVKWCHNLEVKSYHVGNSNKFSAGICVVGDFRSQKLEPIQLAPLLALLKFLKRELDIPLENIQGHSQFPNYAQKECPVFDVNIIRELLKAPKSIPNSLPESNPEFIGPLQESHDWTSILDPNMLLKHPGESIIDAVQRTQQKDIGAIKQANKTEDLKKKTDQKQLIKSQDSIEIVPKQVKTLLDTMSKKGYVVFKNDTKPYNINIIGVRNKSGEPNKFNDEIHLIWKFDNQWKIKSYQATTDPGLTYLEKPMNDDGTAILKEDQYRSTYTIGLHKKKYEALVQAKEVTVIRDYDRDANLSFDSTRQQTGFFGIHIHHASYTGKSTYVNKWSAGCQVIADINDFNELMWICKQAREHWGGLFTYTLLDKTDLVHL
ncbi:MAG: N-acetyl-anhydromuramyl-L-alanine amidase AmpD [Nonlabens sp.]|jgi:N-acetyl-anhydromuramyl-L-alanine amidase AmpD